MRKLFFVLMWSLLIVPEALAFQIKFHLPPYPKLKEYTQRQEILQNEIYNLLMNGFQVIYFYDNSLMSSKEFPQVETLLGYGFQVYPIKASKHPNAVKNWHVYTIPTVIFVSPKLKKAITIPWSFATANTMIDYVYKVGLRNETPIITHNYP